MMMQRGYFFLAKNKRLKITASLAGEKE